MKKEEIDDVSEDLTPEEIRLINLMTLRVVRLKDRLDEIKDIEELRLIQGEVRGLKDAIGLINGTLVLDI